jgi:predicted DsbA family dithiol-disulfide isomerase
VTGTTGTTGTGLSVLEFTDPACPWSWGSEPKFRWLRTALGEQARWRRVFGILFDEDDDPAPDPAAETLWYQRFVDDVSRHTGAPAARQLEWVCLTSWPAVRAAVAAERQGPLVADRVLRRLREQIFVVGRPADTDARVLAALAGVPGLDRERLASEFTSAEVLERVRADWKLTRTPDDAVCGLTGPGPHPGAAKELVTGPRYSLPTLIFEGPAGRVIVPGWRPLAEYVGAALRVAPEIQCQARVVDGETALIRWRTLTGRETRLLTSDRRPPAEAAEIVLRHGSLWVHPAEPLLDKSYQQLTDSGPADYSR